jgi:hypothetical protein
MFTANQAGSTFSVWTGALPAQGSGVETLPWLLLSAALDDPQTGVLIFDAHLRLLHVTSQAPRLLDLQPRGLERS